MLKVRSSRRPASLKSTDYDHEIDLVNHEAGPSPRPLSSDSDSAASTATGEEQDEARPSGPGPNEEPGRGAPGDAEHGASLAHAAPAPSIEIQAPSPGAFSQGDRRIAAKRPQDRRETAIDVLYENERGGFLCGTALFSSKALGSLDPPAWTNTYHMSSPTSIHTAQVPDPSWEWIWPEWRINHQQGTDEGGWEYSFAFSNKFSWHSARWWNSFVRRRAWIRKRVRKKPQEESADLHMLNSDYFAVGPASCRSRRSNSSLPSSRVASKSSMARLSASEVQEQKLAGIEDMVTLLRTLRSARIDREKREAVENYLEHATDLALLQEEMHEIMSLFVFQASRRQLLSHLMRKHDETMERLRGAENKNEAQLQERNAALDAAIRHADEEVRRLAFWSDAKQMAESGELPESVGADQGLDRGDAAEPNRGELSRP